jgi:hypothetical protein
VVTGVVVLLVGWFVVRRLRRRRATGADRTTATPGRSEHTVGSGVDQA